MAIKNKQQKRDYLKTTAISVAAITMVGSILVFWNSFNILNTISTAATLLGIALLPVASLFIFLFWLTMLIDTARERRILWFLFIFLGNLFFAFLYWVVKKPKITPESIRPALWAGLILYILMWSLQIYPTFISRVDPTDFSNLKSTGREFIATVETKELKGFSYEGKTVCKEFTMEDGSYYMQATGGTIKATSNSPLNFYYELSYSGDSNPELTSGWEAGQRGEPVNANFKTVENLVGGPAEISGPLTACKLTLWSSN